MTQAWVVGVWLVHERDGKPSDDRGPVVEHVAVAFPLVLDPRTRNEMMGGLQAVARDLDDVGVATVGMCAGGRLVDLDDELMELEAFPFKRLVLSRKETARHLAAELVGRARILGKWATRHGPRLRRPRDDGARATMNDVPSPAPSDDAERDDDRRPPSSLRHSEAAASRTSR